MFDARGPVDGRSGWYASPPAGHQPELEDEPWEGPSDGSLIRFMSQDGVDVPLWSEEGLIFVDGQELVREWGVSQELATDVVRWGRASQGPATAELDAQAAELVRRLRRELQRRFRILYQP